MTAITQPVPLPQPLEAAPRPAARWGLGRRELVAVVIGSLLYAGITWFTSFAQISNIGIVGVDLRPSIVVPIIIGFIYGPLAGFLTGFIGNTIIDNYFFWVYFSMTPEQVASANANGTWHEYWWYWNWAVGNGIMGMIPGFYATFRRSYRTLGEIGAAIGIATLGVILGMGFASFSSVALCRDGLVTEGIMARCGSAMNLTLDQGFNNSFIPAVRSNLFNMILLVPILLFNFERLDLRSINWVESGVLRRLIVAIVLSAAVPTLLLGLFLSQAASGSAPQIIGTIVISLIFTIANASLVAQSMSRPLLRLTGAARAMADNQLSTEQAEALKNAQGSDEITELSRMFGQMAEEVIRREESLRQRVAELQIIIDEQKRDKHVEEIVDNEFFRGLQTRAAELRARRASQTSSDTPTS